MFKLKQKKQVKPEGGPKPLQWVQTSKRTPLTNENKKAMITSPTEYYRKPQSIIHSASKPELTEGEKYYQQEQNNIKRRRFFQGLENLRLKTPENLSKARNIRDKLRKLKIRKGINNLTNSEKINLGLYKHGAEQVIPYKEQEYIKLHSIIPSFQAIIANPEKYQDKINTELFRQFKRDVKQPDLYFNINKQKKSQEEHTAKIQQAIKKLKEQNQYNPIDSYYATLKLINKEMKHIEQQKAQEEQQKEQEEQQKAYLLHTNRNSMNSNRNSMHSTNSTNSGIGNTPPSSPKYALPGTQNLFREFFNNTTTTQAGGNYSKLKLNKTLKKKLLKKTLKNKYINK